MSREKPQAQTVNKHPDEYRNDLNPDAMAGQNIGVGETHPEKYTRTAYDLKQVHNLLDDFSDDDLKQIPVLSEGSRLRQGATYIDLKDQDRREFTATGEMEAGPGNWYVPKNEVHYQIWNRLIGVDNPERTWTGNQP